MATSRSYDEFSIESLKDPDEAIAYLLAVREDGTEEEKILAMESVAAAGFSFLDLSLYPVARVIL
jgi:hypothetical protein